MAEEMHDAPPEKKPFDAKGFFIGDYDWAFLCMPRIPCSAPKPPPPFFKKDEPISMLVAFIMGLQHCLAMVGGIITVPLILSGQFVAWFSPSGQQYIISAALIISGLASLVQIIQFKIPFTKYAVGSGMLSVMGISFTFLPIAESAIPKMTKCSCAGVSCVNGHTELGGCLNTTTCPAGAPLEGSCMTGEQAYGALLGTVLVCCWLQVMLSFMPIKLLRKLFPPIVTGTTVLLIGFALCKTGVSYWGGGAYCASQVLTTQAMCANNGQVKLPFGSPAYVGLGFSVFFTLIVVELFGSPFMRNVQVALGLMVGMIIASAVPYNQCTTPPPVCNTQCYSVLPQGVYWNSTSNEAVGAPNSTALFPNSTVCQSICEPSTVAATCSSLRFVTGEKISSAPWITFLWVNTYPLGFYPPVVLPMLFGFLVTTMECIGDITATTEASGLVPAGLEYEKAVQGAILADGLACFWGALGTMLPPVTYAQNNGIISLTRCAARRAGIACGILLFIFGVIAKFAAIVLTIPDCVLGGMTSFLFINVSISGMRVITMEGGINRRNRFIAAMALTLGVGVELVPAWFNIAGQPSIYPHEGNFWPIDENWSPAMEGFRDALIIVMTTGFSIGGFTALILNLIMPHDADDVDELGEEDSHEKTKMRMLEEEYPHPHMPEGEQRDPLHPHQAPPETEMARKESMQETA